MTTVSTSRIGRKPVVVPSGVEIKIQDRKLSAKGPKGQLAITLHPFVDVKVDKNEIKISPANPDAYASSTVDVDKDKFKVTKKVGVITGARKKLYRSIAGTVRANIQNLIEGVSKGFERKLLLVGVGYRAQGKGKVLSLSLGYSHPTDFKVPDGITIETPTQTEIVIKGTNKELVGLCAAKIRGIRSPEPYKGKGVRYSDETVELKETKKK